MRTTRRWHLMFGVVVALSLALPAVAAAPPNPKIQALSTELERAASLQQIAQAMKKAGLSQAERKEFESAISPALKHKIETILAQARVASMGKVKRTSTQRFEAARRSHAARMQALVKPSGSLAPALAQARAAARPLAPRTAMVTARPPAVETRGSISSVSPATVQVGGTLTIAGRDLGARGTVKAVLGPRDRFECGITSWTATRIVVTVPLDVEPLVREGSLSGFVHVIPAGEGGGPFAEVTYAPDPSRLTPVISEVNPNPISTSQDILITGRNFLAREEGTVTLSGTDRGWPTNWQLDVREWTDTYIYASVDRRNTPLTAQGVRLVVRNHLGREGTRPVGFVVTTELRTVTFTDRRVHCEHWDDDDDRPSWLCLVGEKKEHSLAWGAGSQCFLRVVDSGYDILDEGGLGHGFAWLTEPWGESVHGRFEVWADLYSWFEVEPWVVVEIAEGSYSECTGP